MGEMTPEKAKSKFMEMKNQATIVKTNSEQSGRGDGSRNEDQIDFAREDGDIPVGSVTGSHYSTGTFGVHTVYCLEFTEENGIGNQTLQQLNTENRLNGGRAPSVRNGKTNRKRKGKKDEASADAKLIHKAMRVSSSQMARMNETEEMKLIDNLVSKIDTLDDTIHSLEREIRKMRRKEEDEDDIAEEVIF
jgi:hypothetical protein